jgi:spore germination protein GerM
MQDKNSHQIPSSKLIIAIVSTVLALGSATAWIAYSSLSNKTTQGNNPSQGQVITKNPEQPEQNTNNTNTNTNTANNPTNSQQREKIEVYWLNDNLEIVSQTIEVDKAENREKYLINAFNQLLNGPSTSAEGTAIPEHTKLNKLTITDDGIHLDLSADFTTGGGSASMIGRLGQIIYTATSLDKNAPVWISVEGQPLELLGGEGLMVEQPMTRALFNEYFQ